MANSVTITGIKAGSTRITATYTEGGVTKTSYVDFTVSKASGSVTTVPTNSNAVYGSGNNLCSAGSGTGTMYYRLGTTGNFSTTIPTTSGLNAGTYTLYYYAAESTNYNQSNTGSISVIVTQKEVTLSWGTTSWTYDGSSHTTTCTAGSLISGDTCTVTLTGNSVGPNVGSATVTASSLSNGNYKLPSSKTKSISITQRAVTYKATDQSKKYDGTVLSANNNATLTSGSLVSGHTATITGSGSTSAATAGSTGTKTISVVIKSGTTNVSDNYAITTVNGTLTITRADGTGSVTMSGWTYGGTVTNPTPTSSTNGTSNVSYTWYNSSKTQLSSKPGSTSAAGTYYVKATFAATTNYTAYTTDYVSFTIAQKEVGLSWGTTSWTYDGSAHSTTCTATGIVSGDTCTVTLTGNSVGKNVGTTTVTASSLSNSNYKLPSSKTKTISIIAKVVTLSWGTLTWPYDGNTHSTTCIVSNLVSGDTCTVTLTGNSVGANVSTATVTASELSNGNYTLTGASNTSKTLSITRINGSGSVTMSGWTYGGTVTNPTPTSSTNGTSNVSYTWYNSSKTQLSSKPGSTSAAGTYYVKATFAATTNYNEYTTDYVSFTISQKEVGLSWGTTSWVYDGSAHSTTCTATGLVGSDTCTVTLSNNSVGKNVGSQTVTASSLSNSNYKLPSSKTKTISITQKEVTLTWGTTSWVYDGSAHSTTCTAGSLISGDSCTVTLTGNSVGANVSTATVTASSLSNSNYKLPTSGLTKTISITQKEVTLTWGTTSWVYDGSAHSTTCTLGGVVSGDTCNLTLSNNSITYVGNVTVSTSLDNSNYKLPSTSTKQISITKATPSVTVTGVNQTFSGSAYYAKVTGSNAKGTLYWKKGSAPTTSSYGGTVDVSSTGSSLTINITSVTNDADDCQLYWLFVPSSTATITTNQTYAANFGNASGGPVAMTINAKGITIPTPTNGGGVYKGSGYTATFSAATGASITKYRWSTTNAAPWTEVTSNPSQTNKGKVYVQAYYTASTNYTGSGWSSSATIEVTARPINVTASSASRAYNGSALTSNSATAETTGTNRGLVSEHQMTSVTVTGSQTYVGSSNNVASAAVIKSGTTDVTSNYSITYVNGTLTITKATPDVTVTGVTEDYTGGSFYATAKANAIGTLYWKKGSAPTTSSNDGNVKLSTLNTATNVTYVKDNQDDFDMYWLFVPSNSDNITTGQTYAANFNNTGGGSSDKVNLTINPRAISNVTASATAVTYNGAAQTASIAISDSGGTLTSSDYTISGNSNTNAGTYNITITGKNNYTGTKTISWTINKRAVTVTAGSDEKTYDGSALTKNSATASAQSGNVGMVSSHHLHTFTTSGSQTLVGTSSNTVSNAKIYDGTHSGTESDVTSNYTITYANGTLKVNKRSVTYTATNQTKVYDGSVLSATNTASLVSGSLPSGHTASFVCTGEIGPGVSTGAKTLSSVTIKNGSNQDVTSSFNITSNNGQLSITNANITYVNYSTASQYCTLTANSATKVIDSGGVSVGIASASATDYNNSTSGISYTASNGWAVSSDGKTITVPENTASGEYNITITASKANHNSKANGITITINSVSLSNIAMELDANTVVYGSSTTVNKVTATYSNNKSKEVKDSATYVATKDGAGDNIVTITTT